jgi:Lar family restriction alleviation protein
MTNRNWAPIEIDVLMRCYYSAEEHNGIPDSHAHQAARTMWVREGCIKPSPCDIPGYYTVTQRGLAMVEALRAVALVPPNELLPCPFCGVLDVRISTRKTTILNCRRCDACFITMSEAEAIKRWNTRT